MGRPRTTHKHLPPRMHRRRNAYYYVTQKKWIPLGSDLMEAKRKWVEMECKPSPAEVNTIADAILRYRREVLPTKAPRTQRDNHRELNRLSAVFGHMPIDTLQPKDVRAYLDFRKDAPVRGNREKALLSHLFNKCREWGYTNQANPCSGVKGNREVGRDRYVDDGEFRAVWDHADEPTRDAMDLAYLTGQRPADILKLKRTDLRDGALWVTQCKTGTKLRISVVGSLSKVMSRILSRKYKVASLYVVVNEQGHPLSYNALRFRFEAAREKAGVDFQFRDLRAKAASDLQNPARAKKLLGHASQKMTEHYIRSRLGERVEPLEVLERVPKKR
jgi:integrase